MDPEPDDGALIEASRSQPTRFAELFDRHYGAVRSFCARRVPTREIDDIAGETFCRAFEHRARYDATRPDARPWLYGIALNVIRAGQRSFTRELRAIRREGTHRATSSDPAAASAAGIDAERDLAIVASVLHQLPQIETDVLLLFVWEELTYEEIAQAMEVPIGTVRSRLFRARQRLRRALDTTSLCRSES